MVYVTETVDFRVSVNPEAYLEAVSMLREAGAKYSVKEAYEKYKGQEIKKIYFEVCDCPKDVFDFVIKGFEHSTNFYFVTVKPLNKFR